MRQNLGDVSMTGKIRQRLGHPFDAFEQICLERIAHHQSEAAQAAQAAQAATATDRQAIQAYVAHIAALEASREAQTLLYHYRQMKRISESG